MHLHINITEQRRSQELIAELVVDDLADKMAEALR